MKLLLLSFTALFACGSSDSAVTAKVECRAILQQGSLLVGKQWHSCFAVPHFKPKNKTCWQQLRGYAKSENAPIGLKGGLNPVVFLATAEFATSAGGILPEAACQRVIAQQVYDDDAGIDDFQADPQATDTYPEPK